MTWSTSVTIDTASTGDIEGALEDLRSIAQVGDENETFDAGKAAAERLLTTLGGTVQLHLSGYRSESESGTVYGVSVSAIPVPADEAGSPAQDTSTTPDGYSDAY